MQNHSLHPWRMTTVAAPMRTCKRLVLQVLRSGSFRRCQMLLTKKNRRKHASVCLFSHLSFCLLTSYISSLLAKHKMEPLHWVCRVSVSRDPKRPTVGEELALLPFRKRQIASLLPPKHTVLFSSQSLCMCCSLRVKHFPPGLHNQYPLSFNSQEGLSHTPTQYFTSVILYILFILSLNVLPNW